MKVLILGHGQHGKDTFAKMLAEKAGISYVSSSLAAFGAIRPALDAIFPCVDGDTLYAMRRKPECREIWKALIFLFNTPDRGALVDRVLADYDMYVGMRKWEEYEATRHKFDSIYWVDASNRKRLEKSMEIDYNPNTMHYVDNNGSEKDLERWVFGEGRFPRNDIDNALIRGY